MYCWLLFGTNDGSSAAYQRWWREWWWVGRWWVPSEKMVRKRETDDHHPPFDWLVVTRKRLSPPRIVYMLLEERPWEMGDSRWLLSNHFQWGWEVSKMTSRWSNTTKCDNKVNHAQDKRKVVKGDKERVRSCPLLVLFWCCCESFLFLLHIPPPSRQSGLPHVCLELPHLIGTLVQVKGHSRHDMLLDCNVELGSVKKFILMHKTMRKGRKKAKCFCLGCCSRDYGNYYNQLFAIAVVARCVIFYLEEKREKREKREREMTVFGFLHHPKAEPRIDPAEWTHFLRTSADNKSRSGNAIIRWDADKEATTEGVVARAKKITFSVKI